ncbi:MAG: RDD family protein [Pseudohongiellaceae bacterium]
MQTSQLLPPASLWRRLAAMVYDSFLVFAIWMIVGFLVLSLFGIEQARNVEGEIVTLDPLYSFVLFTCMLLSCIVFFCVFWMVSGQTLGMQAWKIKIQNHDGSTITLKQSLLRCLFAPVSLILFGLGYFYMYFNEQRDSLHDRISGSRVVLLDSHASPL